MLFALYMDCLSWAMVLSNFQCQGVLLIWIIVGWMVDLRFYVLFNSISVISGRCLDDSETLRAMELRLWLRRFHLE